MCCTSHCVFPHLCVVCVSVQLEHVTEQQEAATGGTDKSPKVECRSSTAEAVRGVSGQLLSIYHSLTLFYPQVKKSQVHKCDSTWNKLPYSLKIVCTSKFLTWTKIAHTCCIIHQTGSLLQNFIIGEMFSDILSHCASVLLTLAIHETRFHHFVHTLNAFTSSYTELQCTCCVRNGRFSANGERHF